MRTWRPLRRAFALSLATLLLLVPGALADPGDLSGDGCLRDLENASTGCLGVQGLQRGYGVAVSTDGRQVYVASGDDDTLTTFDRDPQTGAVTWVGCLRDATRSATGCTSVAGLDGARGIVVSADGRSVYVASGEGDALAAFQRDTSSGTLTWAGCFRNTENLNSSCTRVQGLDAPRDVAISADGTAVYGASANDDAITIFARDAATGRACVAGLRARRLEHRRFELPPDAELRRYGLGRHRRGPRRVLRRRSAEGDRPDGALQRDLDRHDDFHLGSAPGDGEGDRFRGFERDLERDRHARGVVDPAAAPAGQSFFPTREGFRRLGFLV